MLRRSSSLSFSEKRQSVKGIFAVVLSGIALCICIVAVVIAYRQKGQAGGVIGGCGIMALVLAVLGFGFGIGGLMEDGRKHLFAVIGMVLGALLVLALGFLLAAGLR